MNPYLAVLKQHFDMPRLYARLNYEALHKFAEEIARENLAAPSWREEVYPEDDFEFVEFLGWTNTINFHFTDIATGEKFKTFWPECHHCRQLKENYEAVDKYIFRCKLHGAEAKLWSGSYAMDACIARAYRNDGIPMLSAEFYRGKEWSRELAQFVFRGTSPLDVIPMLRERYDFLTKSAERLQDYGDSWMNMFRIASFMAFNDLRFPGVVEMLAEKFESFADRHYHRVGEQLFELPFHKRAHLCVQMYEGRARVSSKLSRIKDVGLLILPADYELPKALRAVGALEYSPELADKILQSVEIEENSREEMEIRLSVVEAGEILQQEANRIRRRMGLPRYSKVEIDYLLWTKGRTWKEPHHLTRTTRY